MMMDDPLHFNGRSKEVSELKFAKLHSPKMKSVYWRYFGFPTNENDRIITKQNIVCTLCRKILTNHGNTTNLRAHLQHRHKELFQKVCAENGIKVPPRKATKKHNAAFRDARIDEQNLRKLKTEYEQCMDNDSSDQTIIAEEQAMLYETMVPMTYEDDDIIDQQNFQKVEVAGRLCDLKSEISTEAELVASGSNSNRISNVEEMDPFQLQDSLVNMIVQDLRNVDSIYDPGMTQFIRQMSGNIVIPPEKKIESLIKELHSDKLTMLDHQFKFHSKTKPYSLGFELWSNVEHKHFLSIYFNFTTDAPHYSLMNQLYCAVEYNKYTIFESIFSEFELENCTAAVVNYDNYEDFLHHFLQSKNIPVFLSYDVTVDKCLKSVFALPTVAPIFEEIKDVLMRYNNEISGKDIEIPVVHDDFPWTYYELLQFFSENVSWPEEIDFLVGSAKTIKDAINTLAITLETLKGEDIPHSSMLSPITTKILNKMLVISSNDDEFLAAIKSTITAELEKVVTNKYLTISALMDPRFHRLTDISDINSCVQMLKEKHKKLRECDGFTENPGNEIESKSAILNTKKSNLEIFFDIQEAPDSESTVRDNSLETELNRYRAEAYASLDESPFTWWNKMGYLYGNLKHVAHQFQCVPCVVNMSYKKPVKEQIYEQQRRFMLTGNFIDAILFLNYHQK